MNLDRLKALIRLANNNPNDNEANLAARKVCKVITEIELEQVAPRSPRTAFGKVMEAAFKEWRDPRTDELTIKISNLDLHNSANNRILTLLKQLKDEISRPKTWNDINRSTEPEFRSKPPTGPPPPRNDDFTSKSYDDFNDFFKTYTKKHFYGGGRGGNKRPWTDSAPHVDAPEDDIWDKYTNIKDHPPPYTTPPKDDTYDPITGKRKPKKQEVRKCSKCGLEVPTFRINEVPWICNPCHWKDKL